MLNDSSILASPGQAHAGTTNHKTTLQNPMTSSPPYDLVIGLDRSDRKADLFYIDTLTGRRWSQIIDVQPEALFDWLARLRQDYPTARVALCVEQPAGAILPFIEAYSWISLYAINPISLLKYRETFVTSRAKDDSKDAFYLAELVVHHHEQLPLWQPEDSATRSLQMLVLHRRQVINQRTGLTNCMQALLKQYFPQALLLCGEQLWRPLAASFLLKWPTLQKVKKARLSTIRQFYYRHGSRSESLLNKRMELLENAVALTDEPALLETYSLRVKLLCQQLCEVVRTIKEFDRRIAEAFREHEDQVIFANFPGAGPTFGPRLLAAMGSNRDHFPTNRSLQRHSGIAPVTKQSGKKRHVHRRYLCPKFLRQTFHEYSKESILHCRWAAAYYLQQRLKGSSHNMAVRALAYKWQRIIWRCWQDRTPYDDAKYEKVLKKRGSQLVELFNQIEVGKSPWKNHEKNQNKPLAGSPQR